MNIAEKLDQAIAHVLDLCSLEWDSARIEQLANAVQSLTYSKWQFLQPYGTATGNMALLSGAALDETYGPHPIGSLEELASRPPPIVFGLDRTETK